MLKSAGSSIDLGCARGETFEQHDLSHSFPGGVFDFVHASFFHPPIPMIRGEIFRRAANSVVSGGQLLIVDHGSRAPWSWAAEDTQYPTADEAYQALGLSTNTWRPNLVEGIERLAIGPKGQKAMVIDTVISLIRHQHDLC